MTNTSTQKVVASALGIGGGIATLPKTGGFNFNLMSILSLAAIVFGVITILVFVVTRLIRKFK